MDSKFSLGCMIIATAAFGSPLEPHVRLLREFRDHCLLTNAPGRSFVRLYYRHSPPIADLIAGQPVLRAAVRLGLLPLVGVSWVVLQLDQASGAALIFFMLLFLGGTPLVFWYRRRRR